MTPTTSSPNLSRRVYRTSESTIMNTNPLHTGYSFHWRIVPVAFLFTLLYAITINTSTNSVHVPLSRQHHASLRTFPTPRYIYIHSYLHSHKAFFNHSPFSTRLLHLQTLSNPKTSPQPTACVPLPIGSESAPAAAASSIPKCTQNSVSITELVTVSLRTCLRVSLLRAAAIVRGMGVTERLVGW